MQSLVIVFLSVLVLLCGQTDRQTDRQTESYTDADDRLTQSTTVGVSNLIKQSTTQIATLLTSISSFAVYSLVLCSFLRALVQLSDFLCNEL